MPVDLEQVAEISAHWFSWLKMSCATKIQKFLCCPQRRILHDLKVVIYSAFCVALAGSGSWGKRKHCCHAHISPYAPPCQQQPNYEIKVHYYSMAKSNEHQLKLSVENCQSSETATLRYSWRGSLLYIRSCDSGSVMLLFQDLLLITDKTEEG